MTVVIDEDAGLVTRVIGEAETTEGNTYPIQVSVYGAVRVNIVETFGYLR